MNEINNKDVSLASPEFLGSQTPSNPAVSPAAGKGIQAKSVPREQIAGTDAVDTPKEAAIQAGLHTPNERDQIAQMTDQDSVSGQNADPMIAQAAEDAKTNLKDTSKALETDRAYAKLRD